MANDGAPRHTNRLAGESSPYLLQHRHNPVDWYPWGEEAFAAARRDDKPVFLSVGYSACHWCHVMERESFEDEATARLLNEHFVSVKVDREERPDVDEIYMTAVQMMTRHGGWPMSVFLLPDGRPFYGGTYFPPVDYQNRPSFQTVLRQLAEAYRTRRDELERVAGHIADDLREAARQRPVETDDANPLDGRALLAAAVGDCRNRFDEKEGGFGSAPKFPPHHTLRLLLEAVRRGDLDSLPMLARTLDKMAMGGIYDQIGGGFHRYSTDDVWLLPHFEKMLYDNAMLARVYADAYRLTGREAYARIARETCDWVLRDMTDTPPTGPAAFHAALDADSEGEEGKYYVWTEAEIRGILGDRSDGFIATYRIRPQGNYRDEATHRPTGANIPHLSGDELPERLDLELAAARATLLQRRYERVPPGKDDKVIASWNGLMIGGLAVAGQALGEERYLEAARAAAEFCLTTLRPDGRLLRRYRDGVAGIDAYLEDYAFLADGLLDLHDSTGEERWATAARELADILLAEFWDDEDSGFFFTGDNHESLIARSKDLYDGALPSPNGVAARVLVRLGALPGGERYLTHARRMLSDYRGVLQRLPQATQTLVLAALDAFPESPAREAASPVSLRAESDAPLTVAPGAAVTAVFLLEIASGWHVNAHRTSEPDLIPTTATLTSDLPAAVGPVGFSPPIPWQSGDTTLPTYQGTVRFDVPITVSGDAPAGRGTLTLTVRYQPCSESECLRPDERSASLTVEVT